MSIERPRIRPPFTSLPFLFCSYGRKRPSRFLPSFFLSASPRMAVIAPPSQFVFSAQCRSRPKMTSSSRDSRSRIVFLNSFPPPSTAHRIYVSYSYVVFFLFFFFFRGRFSEKKPRPPSLSFHPPPSFLREEVPFLLRGGN